MPRNTMTPPTQRDNNRDRTHNPAVRQEHCDAYEHQHFHAADAHDFERSQASARAEQRRQDRRPEPEMVGEFDRTYTRGDRANYNNDSDAYQYAANLYGHDRHRRVVETRRPNDDSNNEIRQGSDPDRDRSSYGNSRFNDEDYGYAHSSARSQAYGRFDNRH